MNIDLLTKLTQTFGPSGYEDRIRNVILEEVKSLADELRIDPLGSLVAVKKGTGGGKRMLLAAHMDEIGLMVTHVEKEGFVRFTNIGGLRTGNMLSGRAVFADGTTGVIYVEYREDSHSFPGMQHMYMDVGADSKESCPVKVGDTGVFVGPLVQQGNRLISKALDDRVGCYMLIEVLRQLKSSPHDLYFTFSTQEEITLSGARTSAFLTDPDIAISIDVTLTGDTPKSLPMDVKLGQGPAIKVKDSGMVAHPMVRDMLIEAAEKAGLPYQMEILVGGTTDAAAMQVVRAGIPSGCVSVPCRFVHSTSEMIDKNDLEQSIQLFLSLLAA